MENVTAVNPSVPANFDAVIVITDDEDDGDDHTGVENNSKTLCNLKTESENDATDSHNNSLKRESTANEHQLPVKRESDISQQNITVKSEHGVPLGVAVKNENLANTPPNINVKGENIKEYSDESTHGKKTILPNILTNERVCNGNLINDKEIQDAVVISDEDEPPADTAVHPIDEPTSMIQTLQTAEVSGFSTDETIPTVEVSTQIYNLSQGLKATDTVNEAHQPCPVHEHNFQTILPQTNTAQAADLSSSYYQSSNNSSLSSMGPVVTELNSSTTDSNLVPVSAGTLSIPPEPVRVSGLELPKAALTNTALRQIKQEIHNGAVVRPVHPAVNISANNSTVVPVSTVSPHIQKPRLVLGTSTSVTNSVLRKIKQEIHSGAGRETVNPVPVATDSNLLPISVTSLCTQKPPTSSTEEPNASVLRHIKQEIKNTGVSKSPFRNSVLRHIKQEIKNSRPGIERNSNSSDSTVATGSEQQNSMEEQNNAENEDNTVESDESFESRSEHFLKQKSETLMALCADESENTCFLCDVKFYVASELTDHMKNHLNRNVQVPVFKCVLCSENFGTIQSIKVHVRSCCLFTKYGDTKEMKCLLCNAHFKGWSPLEAHLNHHRTPMDYNKFKCLKCSRLFEVGSSLQSHVAKCKAKKKRKKQSKHREEPKGKKQAICQEERMANILGASNSALATGKQSSSSINKNKSQVYIKQEGVKTAFVCSYCLYTFQSKISLESHVSEHEDEDYPGRLVCLECKQPCRPPLWVHMTSHTKTAATRLKCPVENCCVMFWKKPEVEYHLKQEHSMNVFWLPITSNKGNTHTLDYNNVLPAYCCYMCFSHCFDIRVASHHVVQHSVVINRYKCLHCYKLFVDPDNLRRHTKSKHLDEITSCFIEGCGFSWTRLDTFRNHMHKEHSKALFWVGNWNSAEDRSLSREVIIDVEGEEGADIESDIAAQGNLGNGSSAFSLPQSQQVPIQQGIDENVRPDATLTLTYMPAATATVENPPELLAQMKTDPNENLNQGTYDQLITTPTEINNLQINIVPDENLFGESSASAERDEFGQMQIYNFCTAKEETEERELQPGDAHLQEFSLFESDAENLKSELME